MTIKFYVCSPNPCSTWFLLIHTISFYQQTGNADTEGRQLVGGFGATMMLHATIAALSQMILKVRNKLCYSTKLMYMYQTDALSHSRVLEDSLQLCKVHI